MGHANPTVPNEVNNWVAKQNLLNDEWHSTLRTAQAKQTTYKDSNICVEEHNKNSLTLSTGLVTHEGTTHTL